jgi:hypothetical protein
VIKIEVKSFEPWKDCDCPDHRWRIVGGAATFRLRKTALFVAREVNRILIEAEKMDGGK